MAFRGKQVTVGTSAVEVVTEADSAGKAAASGSRGATDIWLHGFNDVDASGTKGRKVKAAADVGIDLAPGSELYARTASGSSVCDIGIEGVD